MSQSDLSFIRETMRESHEVESKTKSSLEYCIYALEDERDILIKSHNDKKQQLKSEVFKEQMKREKLAYTLHKNEKANSALVYSTIADNDENDIPSDATLAWFRLDRAQLLVASSTEASNSEKKLEKDRRGRRLRIRINQIATLTLKNNNNHVGL